MENKNLSLEYWEKTWMANKNRHSVFISSTKKTNTNELKDTLYSIIKEIQKEKYPYTNFLY